MLTFCKETTHVHDMKRPLASSVIARSSKWKGKQEQNVQDQLSLSLFPVFHTKLNGDLSPESERRQVSLEFQDFSRWSGWSRERRGLDIVNSFTDLSFSQSLFQAFGFALIQIPV